jgi:hypothetical protein
MKAVNKELVMDYHQVDSAEALDLYYCIGSLDYWIFKLLLELKLPPEEGTPLDTSRCKDASRLNSFHVMAVNKRPTFGVLFLVGHISLKNWTYCPILRDSTTPFKGTCLFIKS